jgi:hypothetical protein
MQPDIAFFALPTRHSFAEELFMKTGTLPVEQRVHDPPCSRLFPNPGYPILYVRLFRMSILKIIRYLAKKRI